MKIERIISGDTLILENESGEELLRLHESTETLIGQTASYLVKVGVSVKLNPILLSLGLLYLAPLARFEEFVTYVFAA